MKFDMNKLMQRRFLILQQIKEIQTGFDLSTSQASQ